MNWNFDEDVSREGTDCIKYDRRLEVFGSRDLIPMWIADMDFRTPDFIISALRERVEHEVMGYSFRPPEYYKSIKSWQQKRHGWNIDEEWICFSPGVVPALNLCTLAFTRPGDSVIIQPPVYSPFFPAVENHGRNLVFNQLIEENGRWTMDFDSLAKSARQNVKMIIISNPHNPVGRAWTKDELEQLADICLKNEILIISDEIHCDLILPGYKHTPIAALSEKAADITVTCIAPSKTFNLAGLSTSSLIISNPVLRKYFRSKIEHLHIEHGNIFGTVASVAAYTYGHQWLDGLMVYLNDNVQFVIDFCRKYIPEIVPVMPEATYMIWLDCRGLGLNSSELGAFFVKKARVGLNDGSSFGPGGEGFMRMNLATSRGKLIKAFDQIRKAVEECRL
jgi:cystathionine beta-lyase